MWSKVEFKTSIANELLGETFPIKKLLELTGRSKPLGQHHMRFTPADIRTIRYQLANVDPAIIPEADATNTKLPAIIVTRMTKGGVGKTSLTVNLSLSMAMMGYRVLIIDCDPQASASNLLGIETVVQQITHIGGFLNRSLSEHSDDGLPDAIHHLLTNGTLDAIASDITLAEADGHLISKSYSHTRAENFFKRNQAFLAKNYDVILVDTAPGTTPIGVAFTYAGYLAGKVLTVVEPEGSCLRALNSLVTNLNEVTIASGHVVSMQLLINKFHPTLKHIGENIAMLHKNYAGSIMDTVIPQFSGFNKQFDSISGRTLPLAVKDSSSQATQALFSAARELIQSFNVTQPGLPAASA